MQKILCMRVFRSLKKHWLRYTMLMLLTVLIMVVVIALITSASSIITSTARLQEEYLCEDGYFETFTPLPEENLTELSEKGVTVEPHFSLDFDLENGDGLRVYKKREAVDLQIVTEGRNIENDGEIFLEQTYFRKNNSLSDTITIGALPFTVVGSGCTSELEMVMKTDADSASDSENFGAAFVSAEDYERLLGTGGFKGGERYHYAYRLNEKMTDSELKDYLLTIELDRSLVTDKYLLETIEKAEEQKVEITDGIKKLTDGAEALSDGLDELNGNSAALNDAATQILAETLESAGAEIRAAGLDISLSEENYYDTLSDLSELFSAADPETAAQILAAREGISSLIAFRDGLSAYTDGAASLNDGAAKLNEGTEELKKTTDELIDEYFTFEIDVLSAFVEREKNGTIGAASADVATSEDVGYFAGVILLVLIAYVISIFVVHSIDGENVIIGSLYALGVKRKQLVAHYLALPVVVTFIGGAIGTLIGFSPFILNYMTAIYSDYFSIPNPEICYPWHLFVYGLAIPPLVAVIVNLFVIRRRLSRPVLKMLRNEQRQSKASSVKIKRGSFNKIFAIRQLLREGRSSAAVVIGLFVSLLIFMLGLDCYNVCNNVGESTKADIRTEYTYIYKYPPDEAPAEGETAYTETLSKPFEEFTFQISIIGIEQDSKYYDAKPEKGKNHLTVSSSLASKYNISAGDKLVLTDEVNETDYAFNVDKIYDYSVGMTAFMDIDSLRELFGREDDYFNTVFSDTALDIDEGRLFGVTTREDIEKSAEVFVNVMAPMVIMMIVCSILIFAVVMYLMVKVMIDRSAENIALMKIFGYRRKEIRRLYLDGSLFVVAVGALICIPLSKFLIDLAFPSFVANVGMGVDFSCPWYFYPVIFAVIMLCYLIISALLTKRLERIKPSEALKNRE